MRDKRGHEKGRFGFCSGQGGAHTARTMMFEELELLMAHVPGENANQEDYIRAIQIDNCLRKRSGKTRKLSARHLVELYSLDPEITLFRVLRYLWIRDSNAYKLLALLSAYARDNVLRPSAPFIIPIQEGKLVSRPELEAFIDNVEPGRFSKATLRSVAQNINSTWTQSGHLKGRVKKIRSRALPSAGSVAYALCLGFLNGYRGPALFETEYMKLLDCSTGQAIELAEEASRKGWIIVKRVGTVIEVLFPHLLTLEEKEWIHGQNQPTSQIL